MEVAKFPTKSLPGTATATTHTKWDWPSIKPSIYIHVTMICGRRIAHKDLWLKNCVDEDLRYNETSRRTLVETNKCDTKICVDEEMSDREM